MPLTRHIIALLVGCAFSCHSLIAQDDVRDWFLDTSPSLLFSIGSLQLQDFEGGIGIGVQTSPKFLWRFSVSVGYSSSSSSFSSPYGGSSGKDQNQRGTLFISPLIPLHAWDAFYVFSTPFLQGGRSWSSTDTESRDSVGTTMRHTSATSWNIGGGVGLGAGVTLSTRISLAAEYRLSISYQEKTARFLMGASESNEISIETSAAFTLMYKL